MNKIPYEILGDFVFRAPIFPVNSKDYNTIINSPIFKEALYLASSDLYNLIYRDRTIYIENLDWKLRHSLLKYISRITSRCTPFGLFAGCGTGKFGKKSEISFQTSHCQSKTRLDMSVLFSLSEAIGQNIQLRNKIVFKPNDTLFKIYPMSFRYIESRISKQHRKYFVSEIDYEDYLDNILNACKFGCMFDDLISLLKSYGFTGEESAEYIGELITNKIIIPENESFATSDDEPIDVVIERMKLLEDKKTQIGLEHIKDLLYSLDSKKIGRNISYYHEIESYVKNEDINLRYLLQSDLSIKGEKTYLSQQIYDMAMEGLVILNKLTNKSTNPKLDKFKQEFYARYKDQEIPLLEALDIDIGIGFGELDNREFNLNPLLNEINITKPSHNLTSPKTISEIFFDKFLLQKKEYIEEIQITDDDIQPFEANWHDLPITLSCLLEVVKAGNNNSSPKIVMRAINGPSAANLMTRFCHANSQIMSIVEQIIQVEQKYLPSNHILAEIVHLPQSRLGNIIHRPIIRNYELPYLTNSLKSNDETIDVSDIVVSVRNGQTIVLRSKKLNKIILPRLTSAHNFKADSLPIYNFLCNLQYQNTRNNLLFKLPTDREISYFPRITYKNIILSPATWIINKGELKNDHLDEMRTYISQRKLPQKVLICEADNKLYIDFSKESHLFLFFSESNKRKVLLEEYLFDEEDMLIKSGDDIYTNQIILSFIKNHE